MLEFVMTKNPLRWVQQLMYAVPYAVIVCTAYAVIAIVVLIEAAQRFAQDNKERAVDMNRTRVPL